MIFLNVKFYVSLAIHEFWCYESKNEIEKIEYMNIS